MHLGQDEEQIVLTIEDDGCGIDSSFDARQHHGIGIMQERARSLNGTLTMAARRPQGTRVALAFRPEFLNPQTPEETTA